MLTLRLPHTSVTDNVNYNLEDVVSQAQWFMEDGHIVPKNQSVLYSKGVLVFYVPRRSHSLNIGKLVEPYNFARLPPTIAGFERLNSRIVTVPDFMTVQSEEYNLRSVVVLDVNDIDLKSNEVSLEKYLSSLNGILEKYQIQRVFLKR